MGKYFLEAEQVRKMGIWKTGEMPTSGGGSELMSDGLHRVMDVSGMHCLICGPTGSGKTRSIGIETVSNLIDGGESYVSIDSKNTTLLNTYNKAEAAGYKTMVLRLDNVYLSTDTWNPLSFLGEKYRNGGLKEKDSALQELRDIGLGIYEDKKHKEAFWPNSARGLFNGVCEALFKYAPPEKTHLYSAYRMMSDGEKRCGMDRYLNAFFDEIVGKDSDAYQNAAGYLQAPSDTRGGILSTALDGLSIFSGPGIKTLLCQREGFEIQNIKDEEKWAIYVILPDISTKYHQIGVIFLMQLYYHLVDMAEKNKGSNKMRWNFLMEEFGNYTIPEAPSMFSAARSRNIRLYAFIQTLDQLSFRYGNEKASVIKNNCLLQYYFGTNNLATLKELQEICGKKSELDTKGFLRVKPVLSISDLEKLPQGYVLIRCREGQFITHLPDWSQCCHKEYGFPKFKERDIQLVEAFDVVGAVTDHRSKNSPPGPTAGIFHNPFSTAGPIPFTVHEMKEAEDSAAKKGLHISEDELERMRKEIDQTLKEIEEAEARELREQVRKGTKVRSAEFGVGRVLICRENNILVGFSNGKKKAYPFPDAFLKGDLMCLEEKEDGIIE